MAGRPRRTRLYDASYNMGEKYYKSALDDLDRKYSPKGITVDKFLGSSAGTTTRGFAPDSETYKNIMTKARNMDDDFLDSNLSKARLRAEKAITQETFFDSRGGRIAKSSLGHAYDDDIDEEVQSSLNRIRANKMSMSTKSNNDIEDTINTVKRRARIDLGEKLLDSAGDDELIGGTIRRRALKMVSSSSDDRTDSGALTKWSAVTETSAASQRAKATKARLNDLENEMFERSEKQLAREQRSANLKKFLVDSDIDLIKSEKHVNF